MRIDAVSQNILLWYSSVSIFPYTPTLLTYTFTPTMPVDILTIFVSYKLITESRIQASLNN